MQIRLYNTMIFIQIRNSKHVFSFNQLKIEPTAAKTTADHNLDLANLTLAKRNH